MFDLAPFITQKLLELPKISIRPRYGFWASHAGKDPRDLYWMLMNEPETDPADFVGRARMDFGSSIENTVCGWLAQLHLFNAHLLKTQVDVGGQNPLWSGKVDFYMSQRINDNGVERFQPLLVEFKTTWGKGADIMTFTLNPKTDHLLQIGLYLKSFHEAGKFPEGELLYLLTSDKTLGTLISYKCRYLADSGEVICYKAVTNKGFEKNLNIRASISKVLEKWDYVLDCVSKKSLPKSPFRYKYPLTSEVLATISDDAIKSAMMGKKILGDWQVAYSSYKTKIIELEGVSRGYSTSELALLEQEYKRRHPKSKIKSSEVQDTRE